MVGICYLCEKEAIGYVFGGYFCEKCEKLKKAIECIGIDKIVDKIKFRINEIELKELPANNTRSKSKSSSD